MPSVTAKPTFSVSKDAPAGSIEGSPNQTIRSSPPLVRVPELEFSSTTKDKTEESSFRGAPQEPFKEPVNTGNALTPKANAATTIEILRK